MELGQYQLQIFIGLVVILIAALVALICDFLKGNNEQLRELTIELKVRRDEERRLVRMLTASSAAAVASTAAPPQAQPKPEPVPVLAPVLAVVAEPEPAPKPAPVVAAKNWRDVLARGAEVAKSAEPARPGSEFPSGFHDRTVFQRLAQSGRHVSGLVVSIGVAGSMPDAVRHLVKSLIGSNDFASQSNDDEFLLIYPNEHGASAHRRLNEIAQQLWNFQLATIGTSSIVFSWGGIEVRNESIDEAIASANERMQETRRGRKLLLMRRPEMALKQAV